ncbi:MAG: site-2 protease family protein [Candidatus Carbobacillus altaicus]|nr:site-2 protease family protein [Candidatus Carbobacillus altaicus]
MQEERSDQGVKAVAEPDKKNYGRWGSVAALLVAFLAKFKTVGLLLINLLKFGKLGPTIWSMLLTVGAYTLIWPWQFAVGLVLMLFIHEMGHIVAARKLGLPVTLPAFIPFLGALIMMKERPQDAQGEAFVALGGPLLGSLGAAAALGLGILLKQPFLFLIAWVGFFLNLINLLPIHPLDGGRIVTAISRWLWVVGLIGGLIAIIYLRSIVFFIIWLLFVWELYKAYVKKDGAEPRTFKAAFPLAQRTFSEQGFPIPGPEHRRPLDFYQYCRLEDRASYLVLMYPGLGEVGAYPFTIGEVKRVEMIGYEKRQVSLGAFNMFGGFDASNPPSETRGVTGTTDSATSAAHGAPDVDDTSADGLLKVLLTLIPEEGQGAIVRDRAYYQVPLKTRFIYGTLYFGLIAALIFLMSITASYMGGLA